MHNKIVWLVTSEDHTTAHWTFQDAFFEASNRLGSIFNVASYGTGNGTYLLSDDDTNFVSIQSVEVQ